MAEAWMLSCNAAGESVISEGPLRGKTLCQALFRDVEGVLGVKNPISTYFPILIKFIDARQALSIQVHPPDGYALDHDGSFGKTEMWYVLDAEKDAFLYFGFERRISREEMRGRLENSTITDVLRKVPVQKGDVLFVQAGTVHAIGEGILIAEIQQNSDSTYRVYDFDRVGPDGKKRELHIDKALDVSQMDPGGAAYRVEDAILPGYRRGNLASCSYFTVDRISVDSFAALPCDDSTFLSLLFIEGEGRIFFTDARYELMSVKKGDSVFLPAGTGEYTVEGSCTFLLSYR